MNMTKKHKVLILSGDLGDGHKQAARAILETSQLYRPDVDATIVDFMEWTHPHLHSLGRFCYIQWVKNFPSVYGYLFQKTRGDNSFSHLFKKIKLFALHRMVQLLEEVQPTVVVSTFPSAAAAMSILKSQGLTDVPTVTVITDHTDHSYWIHPYTDQYLVGSEHVRNALIARHVPASRISATGIPIRPQFSQTFDRDELRSKHGLKRSRPVVLIMGGGLGMISRTFIRLLQSDPRLEPMQFIIVCGRNDKLREKLTNELKDGKHRFIVTGFVDHVHELMALSDLIITKPGGLTTSEAIALDLPMLLYKPLPGQEQDNAAFLVSAGVALQAFDEPDLFEKLTRVFQNPQILTTIKSRTKQIQTKTATFQALRTIVKTKTVVPVPRSVGRAVYAEA
ncbi:MGDG synthase family glycosyltransferase [Paenibacillus contaminans]|nr:glycosyltransferase [Paenibacillus contaminans]